MNAADDPGVVATDLPAFRGAVREWLAQQNIPQPPREAAASYACRREWQRRLFEAGWLGVDWPRDFGGRGLSPLHQLTVMEELIRVGAPLPAATINLYVVGPTLVAWGTREQKARHLPRMLAAEEIWCQGFSEPNAGSDLASLKTRAVVEGDHFVITGQKIWTSQAHYAEYCALLVRTDPDAPAHKGISYIIVDMKAPGITVRPIRQLTGDAEFNEVFFDGVRAPVGNLIGKLHDGWNVATRSLSSERSTIIAQRKMEAEAVFRTIVASLARAVSDDAMPAGLLHRIGHARMQLAVLDAQVRDLLRRLQEKHPPDGRESLDKLVLTEVEQEVLALALDVLGPYRQVPSAAPFGLDADDLIRKFFYSRSWSISGGTSQVQRNIVAQRVLGMPRA